MSYLFVASSRQADTSVLQSAVNGLKLLFFSAGLISTLLMVKQASMPFLHQTFFPILTAFWNSLTCFLSSPLYICIIINSVVLLIAATSSFHHPDPPPATTLLSTTDLHHGNLIFSHTTQTSSVLMPQAPHETEENNGDETTESKTSTVVDSVSVSESSSSINGDETTVVDSVSLSESSSSINGDDTMESTWKAIIGDKKKKLTKSESVHVHVTPKKDLARWKELRKLETFNEGVAVRRVGGLRRDPSVGIDEFNQQVEAFINKFNQDMRLQRQESDQRFLDMTGRGL